MSFDRIAEFFVSRPVTTPRGVESLAMEWPAVKVAVCRTREAGVVETLLVVDPMPDPIYRHSIDRRLRAEMPAGVRVCIEYCLSSDLRDWVATKQERSDRLVRALEAKLARYEQLAPELKAADSTLEAITHEEGGLP